MDTRNLGFSYVYKIRLFLQDGYGSVQSPRLCLLSPAVAHMNVVVTIDLTFHLRLITAFSLVYLDPAFQFALAIRR